MDEFARENNFRFYGASRGTLQSITVDTLLACACKIAAPLRVLHPQQE